MPENNTEINSNNAPTVAQMLKRGQSLFEKSGLYFGHGTDNSWDEAVYLLSFYSTQGQMPIAPSWKRWLPNSRNRISKTLMPAVSANA